MKRRERREAARRAGKPFEPQSGSRRPFKHALVAFEDIRLVYALPPLARQTALLMGIGDYRSRGHGRGGMVPSHNRQAARSKYKPHQGEREMERRRNGGFYWIRAKDAMYRASRRAALRTHRRSSRCCGCFSGR